MLRIAVVTRYFPSSAEPWQGRSAYQTLRLLPNAESDFGMFSIPTLLIRACSSPVDALIAQSRSDVQNGGRESASYHDIPALPLLSRPLNGWMWPPAFCSLLSANLSLT